MESTPSLESVFKSFCGGKTEMANKEFVKFNKDTGLLDKKYTTTDVDINFVKVKAKTSKVITFDEFESALKLAATKKGIGYDDLVAKVCKTGGPTYTGTKADYVKFHDDKSLYTGVYANGGPTNVDGAKDLSGLCDRTDSDVRGIKK
jgi:hypothetical protein